MADDSTQPPLPTHVTVDREAQPKTITVTEKPLDPLQKHGVYLAWGVLGLILFFGLILLILVGVNEFSSPPSEVRAATALAERAAAHYAAASSPETLQHANELLGKVAEAKRASRDFWTAFSQFLLLNLLLPVLTAILGYVFGTMKKDE